MATKKSKAKSKSKTKATSKVAPAATKEAMTLSEWLGAVESHAAEVAAGGAPVGACFVTNPHTGANVCVMVDEKTCKSLKGAFVGGLCAG